MLGLDDLLMSKAERALLQSIINSKYTVLLIGNGFDLACGYSTSYRDFYKSDIFKNLVQQEESCLAQFIQYQNHELNYREKRWADLEEMIWEYARLFHDIQETDGHCIEPYFELDESMVRGFKSMCMMEKNMWWGLNSKARTMLRLADVALPDVDATHFKNEYNMLRNGICQYLDNIVNEETRIQKDDSTQGIYKLVARWVESSEHCTALMFNYTNTLKDIIYDLDMVSQCEVKFLHGESAYGGDGIVVGVDDAMHVDDNCKFIEKSQNDACVRYAFTKNIEKADRYIIFGSTIGETDRWYFQKLFNQPTPKTFEIYYYGAKSLEEICRRIELLSNMTLEEFDQQHNLILINSELAEDCCNDCDAYLDIRKESYKKMVQRKIKNLNEE